MPYKGFMIAIDGPVASGKGTVAAKLSRELSGFHLNTGAVYRSFALMCKIKNCNMKDELAIQGAISNVEIELSNEKVLLNGENVTERIKDSEIASGASIVGVHEKVRKAANIIQRRIAQEKLDAGLMVVAEGRDSATVVFPDAALKVYLTARPEIRAKRRMEQFLDENKDIDDELDALKKRDLRDSDRNISPLTSNPEEFGYFVIDNSEITVDETISIIKKEMLRLELI